MGHTFHLGEIAVHRVHGVGVEIEVLCLAILGSRLLSPANLGHLWIMRVHFMLWTLFFNKDVKLAGKEKSSSKSSQTDVIQEQRGCTARSSLKSRWRTIEIKSRYITHVTATAEAFILSRDLYIRVHIWGQSSSASSTEMAPGPKSACWSSYWHPQVCTQQRHPGSPRASHAHSWLTPLSLSKHPGFYFICDVGVGMPFVDIIWIK